MKVGHKCYVAGVKWLHVTQDGGPVAGFCE